MGDRESHIVRIWQHDGLDCVIGTAPLGNWVGYVRYPAEAGGYHDLDVHGGITFDPGRPFMDDPSIPAGEYVGFDCAHAGDYVPAMETYGLAGGLRWTEATVAEETERLAEQIAALVAR